MLKGVKVCLTEVRQDDSATLYRWINDPTTVRFNAPYKPVSWVTHSAWFQALGADPDRVVFAIRRVDSADIIGFVQLRDIHPVHRSAELTTRIGTDSDRGQGFGSEAVRLAVNFAWHDLNLQRVWLRVFATNERAIRAYRSAGFEPEGTMRRAAWINGDWVDIVVMGQLRPSP